MKLCAGDASFNLENKNRDIDLSKAAGELDGDIIDSDIIDQNA
jgi:hypothetical protein